MRELTRKYFIHNKKECDPLLHELHKISVDFGAYEFGLPIGYEDQREIMRDAIIKWLFPVTDDQKK